MSKIIDNFSNQCWRLNIYCTADLAFSQCIALIMVLHIYKTCWFIFSPPLRRHNSLPTRASAATNEVRNHFGISSLPHSVADNAYPPTSSSTSDSRFRSGVVSEARLRGETSMSFMPSGSRSDHHIHAGLHSAHVIFHFVNSVFFHCCVKSW